MYKGTWRGKQQADCTPEWGPPHFLASPTAVVDFLSFPLAMVKFPFLLYNKISSPMPNLITILVISLYHLFCVFVSSFIFFWMKFMQESISRRQKNNLSHIFFYINSFNFSEQRYNAVKLWLEIKMYIKLFKWNNY